MPDPNNPLCGLCGYELLKHINSSCPIKDFGGVFIPLPEQIDGAFTARMARSAVLNSKEAQRQRLQQEREAAQKAYNDAKRRVIEVALPNFLRQTYTTIEDLASQGIEFSGFDLPLEGSLGRLLANSAVAVIKQGGYRVHIVDVDTEPGGLQTHVLHIQWPKDDYGDCILCQSSTYIPIPA